MPPSPSTASFAQASTIQSTPASAEKQDSDFVPTSSSEIIKGTGTVRVPDGGSDPTARNHSLPNLCQWWLDAGCRVTGEKYPGTRSSEDLTWWRERSPQAVKDDMSLYGQRAAAGVERYVIAAYGPSAQAEKTAAVPDGGSGPTYRPTYRPTYMQSHW